MNVIENAFIQLFSAAIVQICFLLQLDTPGLNYSDLIITRELTDGDFICHLTKAFQNTLATGQKKPEHTIRQILDLCKRWLRCPVDTVCHNDFCAGRQRQNNRWGDQPLAEFTAIISKFGY